MTGQSPCSLVASYSSVRRQYITSIGFLQGTLPFLARQAAEHMYLIASAFAEGILHGHVPSQSYLGQRVLLTSHSTRAVRRSRLWSDVMLRLRDDERFHYVREWLVLL